MLKTTKRDVVTLKIRTEEASLLVEALRTLGKSRCEVLALQIELAIAAKK